MVDQPVKLGVIKGDVYIEAHPAREQANKVEIEGGLPRFDVPQGLLKKITKLSAENDVKIDWKKTHAALKARSGYPVQISK